MELFSPLSNPLNLNTGPTETVPTEPTHDTAYGSCLPPPETEPSLAPCLRINGRLVPNPDAKYCRYFKGQLNNPNETVCPTICPDTCVELWDSCPSGTGQLTSVIHSKIVPDLIAQMTGNSSTPNLNHKDFRECYAFGTKFCTFPETKLTRLTDGSYVCHKDCPPNTYADSDMCYASDPLHSPAGTSSLFCNPQYFTSVVANGKFVGCKKIALGTKDTESCPPTTETIVNESFTSEWCVPKCPNGFYPSPNLDFCFAKCETGTSFQDYVSYFLQTSRCPAGTQNCPGTMAGRCPVSSALAGDARYYSGYSQKSPPPGMKSFAFADASLTTTLRSGLAVTKPGTGTIQCPIGMVAGEPNTGEDAGHCYDSCPSGFSPAELCESTGIVTTSGTPNCDTKNIRHICIASCPANYTATTVNAKHQTLYTCAYKYPNNKVPSDPGLFVNCPTNGTFISVTMDETTLPNGSFVTPQPPVCIKKTFMRNVTCPLRHTEIGGKCIQDCPNNSVPIFKNGTIVCTSTCASDSRFTQDYSSLYSTTLSPAFQDSHCIRKSFGTGQGNDPLIIAAPAPVSDVRNVGYSMGALLLIPVFLLLLKKFI